MKVEIAIDHVDTVPNNKPLHKLKYYGINGNTLNWMRHFLKQRSHRIVADWKHPSLTHVDSGFPQGTVLGPLLFLVHIQDLPKSVSSLYQQSNQSKTKSMSKMT